MDTPHGGVQLRLGEHNAELLKKSEVEA